MRLLAGIVAVFTLVGCAKEAARDPASAAANAPAAANTSAAAETAPSKDDACGLLTLAEIRRVLPDVSRFERNDSLAQHGIAACRWYGSGKASLLEVSVWDAAGSDDTPELNVRTLTMGVADPARAGADAAVRVEKIAGVGDDAFALVEKTDDARGILNTAALLSLKKNGRIATVASGFVAFDDRPRALDQLTTLGKAIATRL